MTVKGLILVYIIINVHLFLFIPYIHILMNSKVITTSEF